MVIQLVRASVKPDRREEWLEGLAANVAQTRREAGCLGFEIGEDLESPNTFLLIERWEDLAAQYEHFRQPSFGPLMETLGDILTEPPEVSVHEVAASMRFDEVLAAAGVELG